MTIQVDARQIIVDAGPDVTITLPNRIVNLTGTISGGNSNVTTEWVYTDSNTTYVTFGYPDNLKTWVSCNNVSPHEGSGIFELSLIAYDSDNVIVGVDTITITVSPNNGQPPYNDQLTITPTGTTEITLPTTSTVQLGATTSGTGTVTDWFWFFSGKEGLVSFDDAAQQSPIATFSDVGDYVLNVLAYNGDDLVAMDWIAPMLSLNRGSSTATSRL